MAASPSTRRRRTLGHRFRNNRSSSNTRASKCRCIKRHSEAIRAKSTPPGSTRINHTHATHAHRQTSLSPFFFTPADAVSFFLTYLISCVFSFSFFFSSLSFFFFLCLFPLFTNIFFGSCIVLLSSGSTTTAMTRTAKLLVHTYLVFPPASSRLIRGDPRITRLLLLVE